MHLALNIGVNAWRGAAVHKSIAGCNEKGTALHCVCKFVCVCVQFESVRAT